MPPIALLVLLSLGLLSDEPAASKPFDSPRYGLKVDLPADWKLAESEREDRVFVALIEGEDPNRPGAVVCELGLAPESLDEYRTRIDGNAKRGGRRGGTLVRNEVVKGPGSERLESLWEFRPGFGGVWREWSVRLIANRQLYTFTLNADEKTYPAARILFDQLFANVKLSPPNTGADRLSGNRWVQREFKFALDLPDDWSPVLAPSEVALFYANGKAKGVWADNLLVLAHEHKNLDVNRLAATFPEQLRAAEPNCEVLSCKVVKVGKADALETVVRTKRGPFSMTILERRFKGERFDYEMKFTVESGRFESLAPAMHRSLDSFKELPGTVPKLGTGKPA